MTDEEDPPQIPASVVRLDVCVRCAREMGWTPEKVRPGLRIGGSKASGVLERYMCVECARNLRMYWS